jgi:endonuclease G
LGAIGFVLTNKTGLKNLIKCSMSIDSVESITGFDFFSELPEYLETFVEESFDSDLWKDKSASYKVKSNYVTKSQCVAVEKSGKRCETETFCITKNCWKHGCDIRSK